MDILTFINNVCLVTLVTFLFSKRDGYCYYDFDAETDNDNLVSGSGCSPDSSEDCIHNPAEATDRLVVTKMKPPKTTTTVSPPTTTPEYSGQPPCDDEDCIDGSGTDPDPTEDNNGMPPSHRDDFSFSPGAGNNPPTVDIQEPTMTEGPPVKSTTTTSPKVESEFRPGTTNVAISKGETPQPPDASQGNPLGLNIGLIVGISIGVVLLLFILAYALYKYRSRDEGTYKIDETKNYRYETVSTKAPSQANGSNGVAAKSQSNCKATKKKGTVKEWYV